MRKWLRRRRFTAAFNQTLDANRERLNAGEYRKCRAACDDKKKMYALMDQFQTDPKLYGGIKDWDWEAILEWVQLFLLPLIKSLLPLLLLLDEQE